MTTGFPRGAHSPDAPDRRGSRRKTALLALTALVILLSGIAIGIGCMVVHFRNASLGAQGAPRRIGDRLTASVLDGIPLTDGESGRIRAVIADRVARIDGLRREYDGKFQEEFDTLCAEICGILGSDRARIWEHCVHRDFGPKAAERIRANHLPHEP